MRAPHAARRLIVLAALVAAALLAPSTASAVAPSPGFQLDHAYPCIVGICQAVVSYDMYDRPGPLLIEVDWDHGSTPDGQFDVQSTARCLPVPLDALDYGEGSCQVRSPVLGKVGFFYVAVRVTNEQGESAVGLQDLEVETAASTRPPSDGTSRPGRGDAPTDEIAKLCGPRRAGETCSAGNGRKTPGGGDKVSHKGWPAITGILWKVNANDRKPRSKTGGAKNDELLGHHGSDTIKGMGGKDVLWGDWDPKNNNGVQRDRLFGGDGDDWIYPSHGRTVVDAGAGKDYIWAFYGRGTIDCGAGNDRVRIRLGGAFKVKRCETVNHFCAHGGDGHGGCRKPGEAKASRTRRGALEGAPA
jgi:RTX calcium-binding nonapeptide repeat (4 copies)